MIKEFQGKYRWLSNFAPARIVLGGIVYTTVEHAYQSAKSPKLSWKHFCANPKNSPGIVKRKSRTVPLREDWEEVKMSVMEQCLFQKFTQEPYFTLLLETGDEYIQEGNNWHDTFWGVDLKTGEGENHLGKLIMKVRKELNRE